MYEELCDKTRNITKSITNSSNNYDEKYLKRKLNLVDDLPLNKTLKRYNMELPDIIIKRYNYLQVLLAKCLYKL